MKLNVLDINGKETGRTVSLKKNIFGVEPSEHSIYLDVKLYLANARQGTHKSKERAEISRTTKKHHKQKGTGGARAGSLRSPLHRGGGTVFGPRPRNYGFKLNKKVKQLARKSALTIKAKAGAIVAVENITFEAPKTKSMLAFASAINSDAKKLLVILGEYDKNLYLSSRNLEGVKVVNASEISTYDIMNAKNIVITEDAVEKITAILS